MPPKGLPQPRKGKGKGARDPERGVYRGVGASDPQAAPGGGSGVRRNPFDRAREIRGRLKAQGRKFSDSADLTHWDRTGVTPEEAGELVAQGERGVSEEAIEFSERFNERYRRILDALGGAK